MILFVPVFMMEDSVDHTLCGDVGRKYHQRDARAAEFGKIQLDDLLWCSERFSNRATSYEVIPLKS
jgi:hypothetical protein